MGAIANMMNRVGKRAGEHRYLRANGDSGDAITPGASLVAAEEREILGHINRAQRGFTANQYMRAIPELRTAYEEYLLFAADHPQAPETRQLANQFQLMTQRAEATCNSMRDSLRGVGKAGPPCEMLQRAAAMTMRPPQ
jgi:hypothetical protein